MAFNVLAYAAANKYTAETVEGGGAVKGKNCTIESITDITGGHRVTFKWTLDDGTVKTDTMDVMNGVDGKGIKSVAINEEEHLIITYTDDTTTDAGKIEVQSAVDSVNGKTGNVMLDASDVGALPDDTPIPSKTSDLTNDSDFVADASYVHTDNNYDATAKGIVDGVTSALSDKVDKVSGKGLSTNDYDNIEKAKVASAITNAVNDLVNYYLKSETYTKTEVDDIVTAIKNSRFEVVATLPTTDIKTNVIYLVPKDPTQISNVKDEYINLDGTTAGWEKIGDTEIDLSDYVTTQALSTALADYTTTSDLTTLLAAKQDTLTFDNAPTENSNNPVKSSGVKTYVDEAIADLDVSDSAVTGSYVTTVSETDGKIAVTKEAADNTPTSSSTKMVTSGGVKTALDDKVDWDDYAQTGAVNLLPNTATTRTVNGITFTVHSDGSVTATGTATANAILILCPASDWKEVAKSGSYTLSGCPSGGSGTTYYLQAEFTDDGSVKNFVDYGSGSERTVTDGLIMGSSQNIYIVIVNGYAITNSITFYPMITPTSYNGDYVPYAKTNQQLTDDSVTWDNFGEFGAVNKLIYPYYTTTKEDGGLTYTDNGDGTIDISAGTTTSNTGFWLEHYSTGKMMVDNLIGKSFMFSVDMTAPYTELDSNNARIEFTIKNSSGTNLISENIPLNQNHNEFAFTVPSGASYLTALLWIASGKTIAATTLKPMLTPISYNGDYVPYAKTNKEITDDLIDVLKIGTKTVIPLTINSDFANDGTINVNILYLGKKRWEVAIQPIHVNKGIDIASLIANHANIISFPSGYKIGMIGKAFYSVNENSTLGLLQIASKWSNYGLQPYAIDTDLNTYIKNATTDIYLTTQTASIILEEV